MKLLGAMGWATVITLGLGCVAAFVGSIIVLGRENPVLALAMVLAVLFVAITWFIYNTVPDRAGWR